MIDSAFLSSWVQPQHLTPEGLEPAQRAFASHPARIARIENFLVEDVASKLSAFLSGEGRFEKEYGVYSEEGGVSRERWEAAEEKDRFFRFGKLVGTPPEFAFSPNALTYLQFRKVFQDDRFKGLFEALTGLELGASDDFGSHQMGTGDFLKPHDDDNRNRRVAIVIYLSPEWAPDLGGALHMMDSQGGTHTFSADYNSMVAFDTLAGTTHRVGTIEPAAGQRARLTIGGWYHNPA